MIMKNRTSLLCSVSLFALVTTAIAGIPPAHASSNPLNIYIGAAFGHADLRAKDTGLISAVPGSRLGSFDAGHSAYQITVGIRGLDLLGAEIDYFHLGTGSASPSWSGAGVNFLTNKNAHVSQKGEAAFAVLYLPVPIINVYLKAGVARLTTDLSATVTPGSVLPLPCIGCAPPPEYSGALHTTQTTFAAGAGVQWKFSHWAIRGDYELFNALGEHPSLVSIGATWSFW
ncbi:MAG: porin family protein [Proteobacteria bacterium]|nr:porin family protein [Pseudomonadota bacterium]